MKIFIFLLIISLVFTAVSCGSETESDTGWSDYRQDMRDFVQDISGYAKSAVPGFIIIPQNGHELLTLDGEVTGDPAEDYLEAIDGIGREDLFYGYEEDDVATPLFERESMIGFMDIAENHGVEALVVDYCSTISHMDDSYSGNYAKGYISFAADHRGLDNIPVYPDKPYNVNSRDIISLSDAKNFLYLLDPGDFSGKEEYLAAIVDTDYDIIIIDSCYDDSFLSPHDVASLKRKSGGGTRLVIAYMSIGEAEDYRYYWKPEWEDDPPSWLEKENPDWKGNYKVEYWDPGWHDIIYGSPDSFLDKIIGAGFDGVYLDIIDAFEYFED